MTAPARLPGVKGAAMSSTLKVNVVRCGKKNRRYILQFDGNISDHYIAPAEGEGEFDFPIVSCMMYYSFQDLRVAYDIKVSRRSIEFIQHRHYTVEETITRLLEHVVEFIGPRTFLVYMPR